MKKIISLTVAILFLVNNLSYALNVQPGSLNPVVRKEMYAGAQQLWRAKVGPGGTWLDRFLSKLRGHHFIGEKPEVEDIGISNIRTPGTIERDILPGGWDKNPIFQKKDLIEALEYFRDHEAQIPSELLEIKEGYYELEKEKQGELPLARIEPYQYGLETRHRLIVHTKLVQMWNHIRENDIWFDYQFDNNTVRTISLAWGIFYWIAKKEMMDLAKDEQFCGVEYKRTEQGTLEQQHNHPKGGGHIGYNVKEKKLIVNRDEMFANQIGGRHGEINDIFGLWFLQSYCFYDSTRYNNNVFAKRLSYILDPSSERSDNKFLMHDKIIETFVKGFPALMQKYYAGEKNKIAFIKNLELAINYHFFSRKGVKVPKLTVDPKLIKEYKEREYLIVGKPMYVGGKNEPENLSEGPKWDYKFEGKALISAGKISWSIEEKVDKLNQLIGQKAVTELTEQDLAEIKRVLDSHWVTDQEFDEMAKEAGDEGKAFCKQVPREARMPFEMILAIRQSAKDESPQAFTDWFNKIFTRIETGELNPDVVENTIVNMSKRLSSEKVPTISDNGVERNFELQLIGALLLKEKELNGTTKILAKKICKKVESKIFNIKRFKEESERIEKRFQKLTKSLRQSNGTDGAIIDDKEKLVSRIGEKVLKKYDISEDMAKLYENDLKGQNLEAVKRVAEHVEQDFLIFAQTLLHNAKSAHQDACQNREDFWKSKVDLTTGQLDEKWKPTDDQYEEKRVKASNWMYGMQSLVESIEKVNEEGKSQEDKKDEIPHQVRDDKSTGDDKSTVKHKTNIVSDHTAPLYKDEGPGVIKPSSETKRKRVWQGVNASREENIEIFIPQSVKLTSDMGKKLIEVKTSMKKIGKVLLWERYSAEGDSIDEFFETLGKNKENTKRIVLTDDETVPLLLCQIDTREEIASLFRDIKMINICLPGSLDEDGQTQWQMDLFMTAILARVLEPGDKYFNDIYILLTDMLEGCFSPAISAKDFVDMLAVKEDAHTSIIKVRKRIKYFLLDTPSVSLIEKLPVEWEAIKEFYYHL